MLHLIQSHTSCKQGSEAIPADISVLVWVGGGRGWGKGVREGGGGRGWGTHIGRLKWI